jgi:pyruvate formate lyase activating enzyme
MSAVLCPICPHACALREGQTGFCRARSNRGGIIRADNYGLAAALALDPIEKKPLARFHPGSMILSYGSFGCNMRCAYCQNHQISQVGITDIPTQPVSPETLTEKALALAGQGNIGIAYTYNEPLVGYEFVLDCSRLAHEKGLVNVLVTNGYVCEEPLLKLLDSMDALNIDLKGFTDAFYKKLSGDLKTVKRTITLAASKCHVEVTTLIVPGENDSPEEMDRLAAWLASVNRDIPLHLSRFFPRYHMREREPTPIASIYALAAVAGKHLRYVYTGNC